MSGLREPVGGGPGTGQREPVSDQKDAVRAVFTRIADGYTVLKEGPDRESHLRLLRLAAPRPDERCVDVGAGPGFVTCLAAGEGRFVVGLDLTPAFLAKAAARALALGARGVALVAADVERMPLPDASVDRVLSHKALHHFARQAASLAEARRVLRPGGRLALADTVSDEDPERAARHNHVERVRDPSHVEMLAPTRLRRLLDVAGFAIESEEPYEDEREVDWWLAVASPPAEAHAEVLRLLRASLAGGDSTGMGIRADAAGRLHFRRREIVVVARPR